MQKKWKKKKKTKEKKRREKKNDGHNWHFNRNGTGCDLVMVYDRNKEWHTDETCEIDDFNSSSSSSSLNDIDQKTFPFSFQ